VQSSAAPYLYIGQSPKENILTKNTTFIAKSLVAKEIMCKFAADKFK
jgi:hypothetical protein